LRGFFFLIFFCEKKKVRRGALFSTHGPPRKNKRFEGNRKKIFLKFFESKLRMVMVMIIEKKNFFYVVV